MASAAEQLAANINFSAFAKADELKKRIWFTLGALLVYRFGTFVPLPGINPIELARFIESLQGGVVGLFNVFSGGAVGRMAILALGIMPYISASIIVQLMTAVVPSFEALKKEGEQGRRTINQYTRYLTVLLATVQAFGLAVGLERSPGLVLDPGLFFRISAVITLVGGTIFLMWLGEQITARGVGNGISLIIFAGIVAEFPGALSQLFDSNRTGDLATPLLLGVLVAAVMIIALIVFVERAQRRLIVQYPKRQMGNRMFQGDQSHLPLKLNTAGVIPPIFASSLLLMPATITSFSVGQGAAGGSGTGFFGAVAAYLGPGQPVFLFLYAALIIFFAFFYTALVFKPSETADNLKKQGGFIPGIRPGERTAAYIDYVLMRITTVGALYLALICLLPEFFRSYAGIAIIFGGTSLLIAVSVTLDTVAQIQGHLLAHQYEGLIKKSKLRGGRR